MYTVSNVACCQNVYLLYSDRFYKMLNLKFLCQYIISLIPSLLLIISCTILQFYKEILLLASTITLIFTTFPWTKAYLPRFDTLYMLSLSRIKKKNPVEFYFKLKSENTKIFLLTWCKETNRDGPFFLCDITAWTSQVANRIANFYC